MAKYIFHIWRYQEAGVLDNAVSMMCCNFFFRVFSVIVFLLFASTGIGAFIVLTIIYEIQIRYVFTCIFVALVFLVGGIIDLVV